MQNPEPSLIVIGGGVTGLATAIAWAKNVDPIRHPVLVLEQQPRLGGLVTSYRRHGFLFDTCQLIPDAKPLLDYLGVQIELRQIDGHYMRLLLADPDSGTTRAIAIPSGLQAFEATLLARYPHQTAPIRRFLGCARAMMDELRHLKLEPGPVGLLLTALRCPHLVRHSRHTFAELIELCGVSDPELRDVFEAFAAFSALPGDRVAALMTVGAMTTSLAGSFRPAGGFIELPYAMKRRLLALGGQVRTRARVERVLVDGGRVVGVRLEGGEEVYARRVVTTIDPKVAMRELVGMDALRALDRRYADKVESCAMSTSSVHVCLGLDAELDLAALGLNGGYNILTTGAGTFAELFAAFDQGVPKLDARRFHTAVICPSLITGDQPTITIRGVPLPMGDWSALRERDRAAYMARKESVADFYIDLVERYIIPGLRRHIVVKDIATPATFARYTGSPTGSNYDMAPLPDNFGRSRLGMRTPVRGLFQPKFSHGIWPSLLAGLQVVDMMLGGKVMGGYARRVPPP